MKFHICFILIYVPCFKCLITKSNAHVLVHDLNNTYEKVSLIMKETVINLNGFESLCHI